MKRWLFGLALLVPSVAFGDQLAVSYTPSPPAYVDPSNVNLYEANTISGTFGVGSYAGSLNGGAPFQIYCVDIMHEINWNDSYTVTGGYLDPKSSQLYGPTVNNALNNVAAVMEAAFNSAVFVTSGANADIAGGDPLGWDDWNAAVQVALWNAEYNGLTSWSSPNLSITGLYTDASTWAQAILAQAATYGVGSKGLADGYAHTYMYTAVKGVYNGQTSDQIGQSMVTWDTTGNPNIPSVPEPSSMALALLGGIGALASVYRRRQKVGATA